MPQGPAGYARRAYATKRRAQRPAGARLLVDRTPILVSLRSVLRRALGNRGFVYSRSGVRLRAITGSTTGALNASECSSTMAPRTRHPPPIPLSSGLFAMPARTDNEIRELTLEQGQQLLDDKARQYLEISGEEFRTRWEAGEIDADDEPDVMRVAMLLPLAG